jgi:hypothetical protein
VRVRAGLHPGRVATKFHLRQDGAGAPGTDFFPWDIGSQGAIFTGRALIAIDLGDILPVDSELVFDYSKVEASQDSDLDPARTWSWNGRGITSFRSDASFERTNLGVVGRSPLAGWLDLRYGLTLRRFLFDGDIFTDVGAESFNFDSLWLGPEAGVGVDLPWQLRLDILYSGFHRGELGLGSKVERPYGVVGELRRDFGPVGAALGYELDHVELERPLGDNIEFAHIRLRTVYAVIEMLF